MPRPLPAMLICVVCVVPALGADQAVPASLVTRGWVDEQVKKLEANEPAAQQRARQQLMGAADSVAPPASYPTDLAKALAPVLKNGSTRAKLNAAVVVEHVAAKTGSAALDEAARQLMDDTCPAIALWGIKAARRLPPVAGEAITRAAVKHSSSAPVVEEAYAALTTRRAANPNPAEVAANVPHLLDLLEMRIGQYESATPPPNPTAEESAVAFLAVDGVAVASKQVKKRIIKDLSQLTCDAAGAVANGGQDRAQLDLVRHSADALSVAAPAVATPAKTLARVTANTPPNVIQDACKTIADDLAGAGITIKLP